MRSGEQAAKASLTLDEFSPVGTAGSVLGCFEEGLEAENGGNRVDVSGHLPVAAAEAEAAPEGGIFGGVLEVFDTQ